MKEGMNTLHEVGQHFEAVLGFTIGEIEHSTLKVA